EKSVTYYKQIAEKYPKYGKAPDALFSAGFILANDLKKYEDATAAYNKLVKDYPNSNWTPQAKEELDNMGLTPEQILDKKIKSKKNM
ncbi:MAG: tetratricopeptide repeat protein, partial [Bacteroidota bacterium]|nr:tetratricopeptide repeat protein [Bacteroidota bacterium]